MFLHKFFHWYHIFFISFSLTWSIHRYITKIFYSYPYLLILFAQIQFKLFHFAYLGMDQTESNTAWCTDSFRNVRTKIEFVNFSKKNIICPSIWSHLTIQIVIMNMSNLGFFLTLL